MREIKFRAMTHNNNVMVFGDLINTPDLDNRIIWFDKNTTYNERVQTSTIGQFTGLKDKNGKEIYEGDILKGNAGIGFIRFDYAWVIEYSRKYSHDMPKYYCEHLEIIGNIHENPELLSTPTAVL